MELKKKEDLKSPGSSLLPRLHASSRLLLATSKNRILAALVRPRYVRSANIRRRQSNSQVVVPAFGARSRTDKPDLRFQTMSNLAPHNPLRLPTGERKSSLVAEVVFK
ncbi:hypothetical protein CCR75_006389 [Bremia lactucae]|uniref:Uncharacterized protein n=1 Tax=Bremia lactucae TaxID=4779 RepID=A0A976NZ50_BRELC|nr:hypothetical protein CCR75_006389 [Bremia lactucae]